MNRNAAILYEGPSLIDGSPIVAIATGLARKSVNGKTGDMIQTWILRADMNPNEAVQTGADVSICGGCTKRRRVDVDGSAHRDCYVQVYNAPGSIFRAYQRGSHRHASADELAAIGRGRAVRLGSYGDPAAVPLEIWSALVSEASTRTGYTHQWRSARVAPYAEFIMASADVPFDVARAAMRGFRSFLVTPSKAQFKVMSPAARLLWESPDVTNARPCPASKEAGKVASCETCHACCGASDAPNIRIIKH